jgi:hypothetical protein
MTEETMLRRAATDRAVGRSAIPEARTSAFAAPPRCVLDNLQVLCHDSNRRVPGRLNRNYQVTMPTVPRRGIRWIVA